MWDRLLKQESHNSAQSWLELLTIWPFGIKIKRKIQQLKRQSSCFTNSFWKRRYSKENSFSCLVVISMAIQFQEKLSSKDLNFLIIYKDGLILRKHSHRNKCLDLQTKWTKIPSKVYQKRNGHKSGNLKE